MDNDEAHVAGDFFLPPTDADATRRKTLREHVQRFIPQQTIIYIQYCLLRIPFLLIYDYLFTEKFASFIEYAFSKSVQLIDQERFPMTKSFGYILHHSAFAILLQVNLLVSIPILALLIIILLLLATDKRLVIFYSYTISFLVIYFDYQMTSLAENPTTSSINMCVLQFLLSSIYIQMLNIRPKVRSYTLQTRLCHFAPCVLLMTRFLLSSNWSIYLLKSYYIIWALVHFLEFLFFHREILGDIFSLRLIRELFHLHQNFGFQTLISYLQTRIYVGTLMKIFWLTKILVLPLGIRSIYKNPYIMNITSNINETDSIENLSFDEKYTNYNETLVKTIYFTALFYGTETTFTLMSLACLISHIMKNVSHRLFRLLHLWTEDVEQIGTVVGVMFFLLLFQSNITRIDLNRRHVPLLKAFSLLIVALFHFLHTILEPQLLKVAMQTMTTRMAFRHTDETDGQEENQTEGEEQEPENNSRSKSIFSPEILHAYHHRHVYTCFSILCLVILYVITLWRVTKFSTWLLAVTAFSLELIVRLVATLAQFTVYVFDAHNRLKSVDSFDEYIFRIKAVTACFEFILGVFLLFNGLYILFFESRGALRAIMLAIHAYLNIIKNLKRGWQIFRNRKSAWDNVNRLPIATEEQISAYNDICPICHNTLTSGIACVTPCAHIYHQKCLQKAFYATQNCALCSRPIITERNQQQQAEHRE